jgi:hypothetical protein
MIAVGEELASTLQGAVDGASHAHAQTLDAARQGAPCVGLDEQMQVIGLYRKVHEAEAEAFAPQRQRSAHGGKQRWSAQRLEATAHPQRDVQRVVARVRWAAQVRDARARAVRRAASTTSRTAAAMKHELQLAPLLRQVIRISTEYLDGPVLPNVFACSLAHARSARSASQFDLVLTFADGAISEHFWFQAFWLHGACRPMTSLSPSECGNGRMRCRNR